MTTTRASPVAGDADRDKAERAALKELAAQQSASQTTTLGDLISAKLSEGQSDEDAEGEE